MAAGAVGGAERTKGHRMRETQARAAMIAAEAQQQMARNGAITALLTNRDNLGPALQQQLDTGMAGYMARLFGGGR